MSKKSVFSWQTIEFLNDLLEFFENLLKFFGLRFFGLEFFFEMSKKSLDDLKGLKNDTPLHSETVFQGSAEHLTYRRLSVATPDLRKSNGPLLKCRPL